MKFFQRLFHILSGKSLTHIQALALEQENHIDILEATMNGESDWMLEEKKKSKIIKYNCNCKEVT